MRPTLGPSYPFSRPLRSHSNHAALQELTSALHTREAARQRNERVIASVQGPHPSSPPPAFAMVLITVPTTASKAHGGRRLVLSCLGCAGLLGALALLTFLSIAPQSFAGAALMLVTSGAASLPEPAAAAPAASILAVTSADGHEGFELISALLKAPSAVHVRAIVANITSAIAQTLAKQGCTLRLEGAPDAFIGASSALILPPLTADRLQRGTAAIAEAAAARVPAAYLLSVIGADSPSAPSSLGDYGKLEQTLRTAFSSRSVILRTFFYSSNLLLWASDVQRARALRLPLPSDACLAPLYAGDVSAVVAALASLGDRQAGSSGCGRTLALTGPMWHGGASIAAIASAAVGSPLGFDAVQNATAATILQQGGGLDPSEARLLLDLLALQRRPAPCEGRPASPDFFACTGRNASSLHRFFAENAEAFRPPL